MLPGTSLANTYKLLLLVCREPRHLLFVGLHLHFIILEVSHYKSKTTKPEIRLLKLTEALPGLYFSIFDLLVLSGFMFEVIDSFHEQSDAVKTAVTVLEQQTTI